MTPFDKLFTTVNSIIDSSRLWEGSYKIPWNNPEFSRRMLDEHLCQDHNLASRKTSFIEHQVQWIHNSLLKGRQSRILDLGCGPGLYTSRLAQLGHTCVGVDFSPASIEYAKHEYSRLAHFIEADILTADVGSGYDLCIFLYGEFNVFPPNECMAIFNKVEKSLSSGGKILIEPQTFESVKKIGQSPRSWHPSGTGLAGLFSSNDHLCLIDNHWYQNVSTALQRFHILDKNEGWKEYRSTVKAWKDYELKEVLTSCGFSSFSRCADWPTDGEHLFVLSATRL